MRRSTWARELGPAIVFLVLVGACASSSTLSPPPGPTLPAATVAPTAVPSPAEAPTPAVVAYGPATVVAGVESCAVGAGTQTKDSDGTVHYRDLAARCTDTTNDPRVTGTYTGSFNSDVWGGGANIQWAKVRLENAGGGWNGWFSGVWSQDRRDAVTIWWTGTGGYAGLSYFQMGTGDSPWTIHGLIFPGEPPAPAGTPPVATATASPRATAGTAAASSPGPTAIAYGPVTLATGTNACPGLNPNLTKEPDGTWRVRDMTVECSDSTDDPRVSGTHTASWNMDFWGSPTQGGAGVQWGTVRLANAAGAWEGQLTGVYSSGRGDTIVVWYRGTGAYNRLAYYELLTGFGPWKIQGQIFPGEPPTR
jgi:hypothetical protein